MTKRTIAIITSITLTIIITSLVTVIIKAETYKYDWRQYQNKASCYVCKYYHCSRDSVWYYGIQVNLYLDSANKLKDKYRKLLMKDDKRPPNNFIADSTVSCECKP